MNIWRLENNLKKGKRILNETVKELMEIIRKKKKRKKDREKQDKLIKKKHNRKILKGGK